MRTKILLLLGLLVLGLSSVSSSAEPKNSIEDRFRTAQEKRGEALAEHLRNLAEDRSVGNKTLQQLAEDDGDSLTSVLAYGVILRRSKPEKYRVAGENVLRFFDVQAEKFPTSIVVDGDEIAYHGVKRPTRNIQAELTTSYYLEFPMKAEALESAIGTYAVLEFVWSLKPVHATNLLDYVPNWKCESSLGATDRVNVGAVCKWLSLRKLSVPQTKLILLKLEEGLLPAEAREFLIQCLAESKAAHAVPYLQKQVPTLEIAKALGRIGGKEAVEVLLSWAKSEDVVIRGYAVQGLRYLQDRKDAMEAIQKMVNDEDPFVSHLAKETLKAHDSGDE